MKDLFQTELWSHRRKRDFDIERAHRKFIEKLEQVSIKSALDWWKAELQESTKARTETVMDLYQHILSLMDIKVIEKTGNVKTFNRQQQKILNDLMTYSAWSEFEKRLKLNALMSFVSFLNEQSHGKIRLLQAPPGLKLQNAIRASSPRALTLQQWWQFQDELEKISTRDVLVAKLMYCTARSLSEILDLTVEDLDSNENLSVTFKKGNESVAVQIGSTTAKQMEVYLDESDPYSINGTRYLFITKTGKPVFRTHFTKVFEKAGLNADLGFKVTAKMIQWSNASDMLRQTKLTREQVKEDLKIKHLPRNLEI